MNITADQFQAIHTEALDAAKVAATNFFNDRLGGVDQFACGFAWVEVHDVRSNSKLGNEMKKLGFYKSHKKNLELWDPSHFPCQNVDTLAAGAKAYANVLTQHGFTAYANSRLD